MPDSDVSRMTASVPSRSGAYGSSTRIRMAAWLLSVSRMSSTVPTARPPIWTLSPTTSWPAFSKMSVYSWPLARRTNRYTASATRRATPIATAARASATYSIPSGPCEAPDKNWRTNWLSESKSSSAGPDSTIRPFHSTAMYSATRFALMMSWVMTT